MRVSLPSLLLAALLPAAHAEEKPRHFIGAWQESETVVVFSGRDAEIEVHLVDIDAAKLELRADLFQSATELAIPVQREISGVPGPVENAVIRPWRFVVTIPEVRAKTSFLLFISTRSDSGEAWKRIGKIEILAFPADLLADARRFAEQLPLWLIGNRELAGFQDFLTESRVEWKTAGSVAKAGDGLVFALAGESGAADFQPRSGQVLVLLERKETAGFWTSLQRPQRGAIISAPAAIFENLKDDPENQTKFLQLFELVKPLHTNPSAKTESEL